MKFEVIQFPDTMFTPVDGVMVAEASDMGNRHLQPLPGGGMGFDVQFSLTGNVVTYTMTKPFYCGDGEDCELAGWEYVTSTGAKAKVFND